MDAAELVLAHITGAAVLALLAFPWILCAASVANEERRPALVLLGAACILLIAHTTLDPLGPTEEAASFAKLWRLTVAAALAAGFFLSFIRGKVAGLNGVSLDARASRLLFRALAWNLAFWLALFVSLAVANVFAGFTAMGHGHQSAGETLRIILLVMLLALPASFALAHLAERWAFRQIAASAVPWSAAGFPATSLLLVLPVLAPGPSAEREYRLQESLHDAQADASASVRARAIESLGSSGSRRAFPLLRRIASNASDPNRLTAIHQLWRVPGGKQLLVSLSQDEDAQVRAQALRTLSIVAAEPGVWPAIAALLHDRSPVVLQALCEQKVLDQALKPLPAKSREEARAVLRQRLDDPSPELRLLVSQCLGGQEPAAVNAAQDEKPENAALAIVLDPGISPAQRLNAVRVLGQLGDARAADVLWQLEVAAPGGLTLPEGVQQEFRSAAAEALDRIFGAARPERYPPVLRLENSVLADIREVIGAQLAFRSATGSFAATLECLATPEACGAGMRSFLGPHLASLVEKDGYLRRFLPGPAATGSAGVSSWAYLSVPAPPRQPGLRAFCADDTVRICFSVDGQAPDVRSGRCPESEQEPANGSPGGASPGPPKPCLPRARIR